MVARLDLADKRFGRLVALTEAGHTARKSMLWLCRCDCGETKIAPASKLNSGELRSCGCLSVERSTKHGSSKHRLYRVWAGMRQRCNNPNSDQYHNYGGRGITSYPDWEDFAVFLSWAEGAGWKNGLEIDRIDVNAGYSPDNCRFVTRKINARNLRTTKWVTYNGRKISVNDLADEHSISKAVLIRRIFTYQMTAEEAVALECSEWATRRFLAQRRLSFQDAPAIPLPQQ